MKTIIRVVIAIVIAIVLVFSLTDRSDAQELAGLRQRVNELEAQLREAQKSPPTSESNAGSSDVGCGPVKDPLLDPADALHDNLGGVPVNDSETKVSNGPDMSTYLYQQLESDDYADWLYVAECDETTSNHLLIAAQNCAGITNGRNWADSIAGANWAESIAGAISENPQSTDAVMTALCESGYYAVWKIIAESAHSEENTLVHVAEKCAGITNDRGYAESIASAISRNPNCTPAALLPLANSTYSSVKQIGHETAENATP